MSIFKYWSKPWRLLDRISNLENRLCDLELAYKETIQENIVLKRRVVTLQELVEQHKNLNRIGIN